MTYTTLCRNVVNATREIARTYEHTLSYAQHTYLKSQITFTTVDKDSTPICIAKPPPFYLLPKLHKLSLEDYTNMTSNEQKYEEKLELCKRLLKGRPIVSCPTAVTMPASKVAALLLQPYLNKIPSILQDTIQLINAIESTIVPQEDNIFLLSADVESLYTNIKTSTGLHHIDQFLTMMRCPTTEHELILELLRIVLRNNVTLFNQQLYLQLDGTAMGTNVGPPYANAHCYVIEQPILEATTGKNVLLYRRLLDDIFIIVRGDPSSVVHQFNSAYNNAGLKLDWKIQRHDIEFLDLVISKGDRYKRSAYWTYAVTRRY